MIIDEAKNSVIKSDNLVENNFTIKNCSKAFRILSDKLYSDKIGAVIRELSTNAYDSHVEANNPNPFDVHLPNMIEPYFYIRDYGTGISPENIINVYCEFFNSTRSNSNEMVGMLGLGSKSPFCYTDKFSVTSWYNGKKHIYSAYINETGVPSITKMFECESNEPNGLEIKFPVNSNDFREFAAKISTIYQYFKIKPNIIGINQTIPEVNYILKGNGWGIREGSWRAGGSCNAIMGNISYPIAANNLGALTDIEHSLFYSPIDINFNIGEVDIAASREQLSYDDISIKNIKRKISFVRKNMVSVLNDSISSAKTLWDARIIISKWRKNKHLIQCDFNDIEWNGKKVSQENDVYNLSHVKFAKEKEFNISRYIRLRKSMRLSKTDLIEIGEINKDIKILHIEAEITDEIKCINRRLSKLMETFDGEIFVVQCLSSDLDKFNKILGMDSSQKFELLKNLPYDKIIRTRIVSNNPTVSDERNGLNILKWDYDTKDWVKTDKVLSYGGIYLPINRYKIMDASKNECNFDYINCRVNKLESIFKDKVEIYGIREKCIDEVKTNKKWVHLNDYFLNKIYNEIKKKDILEGKYYSNAIDDVARAYPRTPYWNNVFSISVLCRDVLNDEIIDKVSRYRESAHLFTHIEMTKLYKFLNITSTDNLDKYIKELKSFAKKFIKQYPMIKVIDPYFEDENKNIIIDYIKSCSEISSSDSEKKIKENEEIEKIC
jgi:hypothetical protein